MEKMRYAEEIVREFLIFRGFTSTLQAYESELLSEHGRNFDVDKITNLVFYVYIPTFQSDRLLGLLAFLKQCLTLPSDSGLLATLQTLELSILRWYVVNALKSMRSDKVTEFLASNGNYMMQKREDWLPWFAIPYMKNPNLDPQFRVYFSKEWLDTLVHSFRNFLSKIFNDTRTPTLLRINIERGIIERQKNDIKQLNNKLSELQALLERQELQKSQLIRLDSGLDQQINDSDRHGAHQETSTSHRIESLASDSNQDSSFEDLPEVQIDIQESFLGHSSPISRCRFSASGAHIASASMDGTVRVWTYDTSTPSKNATIYCGSGIMSLCWECRSDRLLLIGTSSGNIKAWNADSNRVICDLSTSKEFPSVLDLKCSPVDPIFVTAAASKRLGTGIMEEKNLAYLTVWNMKTWKATNVLPLGEEPPAITSICFNHNGKILAASATDGMIHMFDMSSGFQITGWPAHDVAVSSILFGPAETSIYSFGSDGKIVEWSLQKQGHILWSQDSSRFCHTDPFSKYRHEMALDSNGAKLLTTSELVRSPIYQVQGRTAGWRTLPHSAPITSVDWHPALPVYITGSADQSVRVTSVR